MFSAIIGSAAASFTGAPATGPIAVLLAGQSNMVGRRTATGTYTLPASVYAWTAADTLVNQAGNTMLPHPDGTSTASQYTPTVRFLTALAAANPGRDIHVIPCAVGSTDFATAVNWDVGGGHRQYLIDRLTAYHAAPGSAPTISAFLHVGHEFAGDDDDYLQDMQDFIATVRTLPGCSATMPVVLAYVQSATPSGASSLKIGWVNKVNNAIAAAPYCAVIDTHGLTMEPTDNYHFNIASYEAMDALWMPAYLAAQAKTAATPSASALRKEWYFGADNPSFLAGQPGSLEAGVAMTEGATAGTQNAGFYRQGGTQTSGLISPLADTDAAVTVLMAFRPTAVAASGLLGTNGAGNSGSNRFRSTLSSTLSLGIDLDATPLTGGTGIMGGWSTTDFNLFAVVLENGGFSIAGRVYGDRRIAPYTAGYRGAHAPSGGLIQIGNLVRGSSTYASPLDFAYFGVFSGALRGDEIVARHATLKTQLAARGVTLL